MDVEKTIRFDIDTQRRKHSPWSKIELGPVLETGSELLRKVPVASQKRDTETMLEAVRQEKILSATYTSVRRTDGLALISLFWKTLRVVIPGDDFFAYSDLRDIDRDTDLQRATRQVQMAGRYSDSSGDAVISFVPLSVEYDERGCPYVIGSRKKAMDIKRRAYFFSDEHPAQIGSRAIGSIVTRNPGFIRVEAFGCESVLGRGQLSAFEYISDIEELERFSIGNAIEVAITDMYADANTGDVKLRLSHAAVELGDGVADAVSRAKIGERFSANVIAITSDHYILMLNGYRKRALVHKNNYKSDAPLSVGDRVSFIADDVDEERDLLMGRCIRR